MRTGTFFLVFLNILVQSIPFIAALVVSLINVIGNKSRRQEA